MAHYVWQIARGTTSVLNSYRGPAGELVLNTSTNHVVCQLGSGSVELANKTDVPSYGVATSSANGLMSSTDKSKLDGVQANATKVAVTQTLTSGTEIASISINDTPVTLYAPTGSSGGGTDYVTVTGTNIDLSQGDVFYKVLSANTTFTFSNLPTGSGVRKITIILKNGDNFTVTWPNSVKWVRGAAPSIYTNVYMVEFTILGTDIVS